MQVWCQRNVQMKILSNSLKTNNSKDEKNFFEVPEQLTNLDMRFVVRGFVLNNYF